ncbi:MULTISPECIES: hypothetical protein [Sphingobium]|jgi:hypothetical protein|uniref:Uncharacterized protein n=2 Tax=Sphingobium TaxID=165695 RepID=T0IY57_9SPHN|nr:MULTISPECIES: hypothetical protein [Sphingobium]EQB16805.1 hypothetical protein RLDS_06720 [Sphingobium lactosutens DS20]QNG49323.1 hypothetical protein H3V42_18315 [Sphingobium yanoikuyae]
MADITQLPIMRATDAEATGFARLNDVATLPVDIPNGNFTTSAHTKVDAGSPYSSSISSLTTLSGRSAPIASL